MQQSRAMCIRWLNMGVSANLPEAYLNHRLDRLLNLIHDLNNKFSKLAFAAIICIIIQEW